MLQDIHLVPSQSEIDSSIGYIKNLLGSMNDGRITVSPYDTAWVALIKDLNGHDAPQFPSSIEWISNNQLSDGSWGDELYFLAYDRLLNTLACVVALTYWNVHTHKSEKGTYLHFHLRSRPSFIKQPLVFMLARNSIEFADLIKDTLTIY